ncbi:lcfB [Symbiodinium sp. CCMP2456]|nr:lcfB [Symbiodinium sp. CCMP2456]
MTGLPIDQVDALSRVKTTEEIGGLLQGLVEALGFAAYSYVHVRPPLGKRIRSFVPADSPNGRVVHEFLATFPDSWIGHYLARGYGDIDPTFLAATGTTLPFDWLTLTARGDLSSGQRRLLNEAEDFGLGLGATVPIHGPDSGLSTLNVTARQAQPAFEGTYRQSRHDLVWIAAQVHEAFLRLSQDAPETQRVRLTDRERDCLLWTARGKTAWEVGQILSISEETVLFHLKNGTRKLGVFSKHHAVVKACRDPKPGGDRAVIDVVTPDFYSAYAKDLRAMFQQRFRVFRQRLGWDVSSEAGEERDGFDTLYPTYLLASDQDGALVGSWRFLPTTGPYMLRDVFPELLEGEKAPYHPLVWEGSRFAVEGRSTRGRTSSELLCAVTETCLAMGIRELITVYDARMERLLPRLGCPPRRQSEGRRIGKEIAFAGRFDMTHATLANLRAVAGIRGSVIRNAFALEQQNEMPIELRLCDPLQDAEAIKRCLDYLRIEAKRTGLSFAAHLIGVAAEAVEDSIALTEKSVAQVERKDAKPEICTMSLVVDRCEGFGDLDRGSAVPALKGLPLLGLAPALRRDPLRFFTRVAADHGDAVWLHLGPDRVLMVNDPAMIRHVLQDNRPNYVKSRFYDMMRPVLGEGIFLAEGDDWLGQRKTALRSFQGCQLRRMTAAMQDAVDDMLQRWQLPAARGEALDVVPEMMRLTLDILMRTLFSVRLDGDHEEVFQAMTVVLRDAERRVWSPFQMPRWLPTARNRSVAKALAVLDRFVYTMIAERRRAGAEERRDSEDAGGDLLDLLLAAQGQDTDRKLRDQILSMVLAGHETTANALAWCWYLLSLHPESLRRVTAEAEALPAGRPPAFAELAGLTYTRCVFDEALRLYPPLWTFSRTALAEDEIAGLPVAAGTNVMLNVFAVHRRPELWDNPEGFDPARFDPETGDPRRRFAYFPFSDGPRSCLGERFAVLESLIAISSVVRRFDLHLLPGQDVRVMPAPVLVILIYLIGLGIVYPALPFQALALGASPLQVSMILVTDTAMVLLLAPLFGRLSDRFGRRGVTCLALATAPFAYLLMAYADSLLMLFAARALAGVSNAAVPVIQALMADSTCPKRRVHGMANVNSAFALAFIVGPLLSRSWLLGPEGDDYQAGALGGAGFAVLAVVLAVLLLREVRQPGQAGAAVRFASSRAGLLKVPQRLFLAPLLLGPIVIMALLAFAYAAMEATLGLWSDRVLAWRASDVALGFICAGVAALFSLWVLIPLLCRRIGEEAVAAASSLAMVFGLLLFAFWPGDLAIAFAMMLLGAGVATSLSCLQALLSKAAPASAQGAVLGVNHAVLSIARILGPIWGGFALGSLGTSWPHLSGAVLVVSALIALILLYRPRAQPQEAKMNVASFLDATATRTPAATAVVHDGRRYSYRQVVREANRVANGLQAEGFGPGSRIALACNNRPGFLAAYYGILKIGAVAVVLSTTLRERDIRFQLEDSGAEALLCFEGCGDRAYADEALPAADAAPHCAKVWVIPARPEAASTVAGYPALADLTAGQSDRCATRSYAAQETAVILYTSGSTGRPKGVELTQSNLIEMVRINRGLAAPAATAVRLVSTPLFHVMGQICGMNLAVLNGETMVLVERFDPALIWRLIVEEAATYFVHMPIFYRYLLERADAVDTAAVRRSLRLCATGGAPLQDDLRTAFQARFGLPLVPGYGLTEVTSIVAWGADMPLPRATTVGKVVPGVEAVVADGAGRALAPGEEGEILVRGPGVMKRYLNLPDVTGTRLRHGWFHTGDIGRFDGFGRLDVLGRVDDKILRGEEHIYPAEVETALKGHPAVREAAVIGIPDDVLGQEAKTFVVLKEGCALSGGDLLGWLARTLPDGKCPGLLQFQESLPLTPTGKVARHLLR